MRLRRLVSMVLATLSAAACAMPRSAGLTPPPPVPEPTFRPMEPALARLGRRVRVIRFIEAAAPSDEIIVVEIVSALNDGLQKGVVANLGQYVRQVFDYVKAPFATIQQDAAVTQTILVQPQSAERPLPPPTLRVKGGIVSVLVINSREQLDRIDLTLDHPPIDVQRARGRLTEVTEMKVSFTLERANGLAMPGGTATYRVLLAKRERSRSLSVYVSGTGTALDRKLAVVDNASDALLDATSAIMIELIANTFQAPSCLTVEAICANDQMLESRVRDGLRRLSRFELLLRLKKMLFLRDASVDMGAGPGLTKADNAEIARAMSEQRLDVGTFADLVEMAVRLWRTTDYETAATRVDDWIANRAQQLREVEIQRILDDARRRVDAPPPKRPAKPHAKRRAPPPRKATAKAGEASCTARKSGNSAVVSCTVRP